MQNHVYKRVLKAVKVIAPFVLIGSMSCQKTKPCAETFPIEDSGARRWSVYEGKVPLNEETYLQIEVSMLPSEVLGEGAFRLTESLQVEDARQIVTKAEGRYSTIYGDGPENLIVHLHNSAHPTGFSRTYLSRRGGTNSNSPGKVLKEELFRQTELTLKSHGRNKLLVLDQHLEPVALDAEYNLFKRTSVLFTVEGYFRHNGDTADFFEINTQEKWPIAKLASYENACKEYHKLVKEKHEVTYMKATAYAINQFDQPEEEAVDALVFKKILQMTTTPDLKY